MAYYGLAFSSAALLVLCLILLSRTARLEKRIRYLEDHAHRHADYAGLGQSGRDVKLDECDHGIEWDECPVCNH